MRAATVEGSDEIILEALSRLKGISRIALLAGEDRRKVLEIEEEAEAKSLMGLGKVINAGVRAVIECDRVYVALTNMEFNWGYRPNLLMKKGGDTVGEEVTDEETIERLSKDKNNWFMHKNFVVFKDKVSFPQDVMKKICHFEIPYHPAPPDWCLADQADFEIETLIYGSPSTACDIFLKSRYFEGTDERGSGTILIGVNLK
jgi:hypothetical protein